MSVTIGIVTTNRVDALRRLLDSPYYPRDVETVVLDQGSTDGTPAYLIDTPPVAVTYWRSEFVAPLAVARQRIIDRLLDRLAPHDVLVFLDDDVVPTRVDWLARLTNPVFMGDGTISGWGGRMVDRGTGRTAPAATLPGPVHYVGGGRMAVLVAALKDDLAFDPRYPGLYFEDVDFCFQAWARGGAVWGCGEVGLDHRPDGAHGGPILIANRNRFRDKWHGAWPVSLEATPDNGV